MIGQILELYSRCGESIKSDGINGAVLPIFDAIEALNLFAINKWVVLGGDLYLKNGSGEYTLSYENWYYNGENSAESLKKAQSYLMAMSGAEYYVLFVIK